MLLAQNEISVQERKEHASLIGDLAGKVNDLETHLSSIIQLTTPSRKTPTDKVLLRLRLCALNSLKWRHQDVKNHRSENVVPYDTIATSENNCSKPTDCMLDEFKAICAKLDRRCGDSIVFEPNKFSILCGKACEMDSAAVIFKDYATMCGALDIDTHTRFSGGLRTKEEHGEVIAVQVTGILSTVPDPPNQPKIKLHVGDGESKSNIWTTSIGNVLTETISDELYRTFRAEPDVQHQRPVSAESSKGKREYKLIWSRHALCKPRSNEIDSDVWGKLQCNFVNTIVRSKSLGSSIVRELVGSQIPFVDDDDIPCLLNRLCNP